MHFYGGPTEGRRLNNIHIYAAAKLLSICESNTNRLSVGEPKRVLRRLSMRPYDLQLRNSGAHFRITYRQTLTRNVLRLYCSAFGAGLLTSTPRSERRLLSQHHVCLEARIRAEFTIGVSGLTTSTPFNINKGCKCMEDQPRTDA
jgi:hypothetical protein